MPEAWQNNLLTPTEPARKDMCRKSRTIRA